MDSYTQLFCLVFSFIYGILVCYFNNLNYKFLLSKNIFFKILISFLYVLDMALLYIVVLYLVNDGILHIYFVLFLLLGYIFMLKNVNKKNSLN